MKYNYTEINQTLDSIKKKMGRKEEDGMHGTITWSEMKSVINYLEFLEKKVEELEDQVSNMKSDLRSWNNSGCSW